MTVSESAISLALQILKGEKSLQQGIRAEMVIILLCCECVGGFFPITYYQLC